jgi:hypothetical protein
LHRDSSSRQAFDLAAQHEFAWAVNPFVPNQTCKLCTFPQEKADAQAKVAAEAKTAAEAKVQNLSPQDPAFELKPGNCIIKQ